MKTIELTADAPTLQELSELAEQETVILETAQSNQFLPAELDEFELEVGLLKNSIHGFSG